MASVYILNKKLWVKGVKGFIGKYQTLLQRCGENLNMNQWEEPRDRADGEASLTTMYQLVYIHLLEVSALKYQLKVSACVHFWISRYA